eukprot:SAG22_NODE_8274_length_668_cov_0.975395_2_plen_56_part_00
MGGLYVVDKDGEVQYTFVEENFGDHAPVDQVMAAAKACASTAGAAEAPAEPAAEQ